MVIKGIIVLVWKQLAHIHVTFGSVVTTAAASEDNFLSIWPEFSSSKRRKQTLYLKLAYKM